MPLRLFEKDRRGAKLVPDTTGGYASNSAVGRLGLLHPKTCAAPVERLVVVDRWRVKDPSTVVTEAGDRKTLIRHRESIGWVVLNR